MYTITKTLKFEAAHRLIEGYKGNCKNIHGHSWVVKLTLAGDILNKHSMLKDFAEVKKLKAWVDLYMDHAMLVSQKDIVMINFLKKHKQKHYVLPRNPTSEVIAERIYRISEKMFETSLVKVALVEIEETCTSNASYGRV